MDTDSVTNRVVPSPTRTVDIKLLLERAAWQFLSLVVQHVSVVSPVGKCTEAEVFFRVSLSANAARFCSREVGSWADEASDVTRNWITNYRRSRRKCRAVRFHF